ncbi:MAG: NADH-ubiquinone oxidoreductase-F iron-sulfur binding region domain-containing protein [Pseudomonadota bacterium]
MTSSSDLLTVYIAADTGARSVGADELAVAVIDFAKRNSLSLRVLRPGSRGMYWLEPMLEVSTETGRVAFGPLQPRDVDAVLRTDGRVVESHPKYLGPTERIEQLRCQKRKTFKRIGLIEPTDIGAYREHDGFAGLICALSMSAPELVDAVTASGLRGRGGAAFPTGIKWKTVLEAPDDTKYIVCNADEGDSGTFADRMVMESDPFMLVEGMTIAGLATGAHHGYVYLRAEYPQAVETMNRAIRIAIEQGFLGDNILGSGRRFTLEVRQAAGAYICGEETSLLESLEGKRGVVRYRPPLPAIKGLFGKPTVVNNVISLAAVPGIIHEGADTYASIGAGKSRGTITLQLGGNVKRGGLFEVPFGVPLRDVLFNMGGGSASGRPIRAVQAGGPLGAYIPESKFDTPIDYEAFKAIGAMLGHGGLVVFDDTVDLGHMARFAMEFCAIESCGKCTPCRIGAVRGAEVIDEILDGRDVPANRALLRELCDTMIEGSLCGLGGMAPLPVVSVLDNFSDDLR